MKHRHLLQRSRANRAAAKAPPSVSQDEGQDDATLLKRKKRRVDGKLHHHEMHGAMARHHLGKPGRKSAGARSQRKPFDAGGNVRNTTTNDPGGEIAAANRDRKGFAGRMLDELIGGPRPAYARGGKAAGRRYGAGGAADANAPLSLNPADYSNVGMNAQGQWINSTTGKLLDQPPPLSPAGIAYMQQAARNPQVMDLVKRVNAESELRRVMEDNADATSIPGGLAKQSGGRIKPKRYDIGGEISAANALSPNARGEGVPRSKALRDYIEEQRDKMDAGPISDPRGVPLNRENQWHQNDQGNGLFNSVLGGAWDLRTQRGGRIVRPGASTPRKHRKG